MFGEVGVLLLASVYGNPSLDSIDLVAWQTVQAATQKMSPMKNGGGYTAGLKLKVVAYAHKYRNDLAGGQSGFGNDMVSCWRRKDLVHTMKKTNRAVRGQKPKWG